MNLIIVLFCMLHIMIGPVIKNHIRKGRLTPDLLFRILGDKWLRLVVLLLVLAALAYQVSLVVWQFIPTPEQVEIGRAHV